MKHLLVDYKSHLKKNNKKLCEKKKHAPLSLKESQQKLRQQYDQNFPMKLDPLFNKFQGQKIEIDPKKKGL